MCRLTRKEELVSFSRFGWHKGFYQDADITKAMCKIRYTDFFEYPDDDEFPYDSAHALLRGSLQSFCSFSAESVGL